MRMWRGQVSPSAPQAGGRRGTAMLAGAAVLALALLPALAYLAPMQLENAGHDFFLLYAAARILHAHHNPYDAALMLREAVSVGLHRTYLVDHQTGDMNQPYVYAPLVAWLIGPLTLLDPTPALILWRMLSLASVFVGTLGVLAPWANSTSHRLFAPLRNRLLVATLVTISPLTLYGLYWGNLALVVYGAMGGWLWLLSRNHPRADVLAGAVMSAALLKPQLALPLAGLAFLCLVRGPDAAPRRRHILVGLLASSAGLLLLDVLATGVDLLVAWPQSVLYLSRMALDQTDMPSLIGAARTTLVLLPVSWQRLVLTSMPLIGAVVVVALWRWLNARLAPAVLFAVLTLLWCIATPYAHANDMLLFVPVGLALADASVATIRQITQLRRAPLSPRARDLQLARPLAHVLQLFSASVALVSLSDGAIMLYLKFLDLAWIVPMVLLVSLAACVPVWATTQPQVNHDEHPATTARAQAEVAYATTPAR